MLSFCVFQSLAKISLESLTNSFVMGTEKDLFIKLILNKAESSLTILDTGVGMKIDELKELDTSTHFCTKCNAFLEPFLENIDSKLPRIAKIGAAFGICKRLSVISKYKEDEMFMLDSKSAGTYGVFQFNGSCYKVLTNQMHFYFYGVS